MDIWERTQPVTKAVLGWLECRLCIEESHGRQDRRSDRQGHRDCEHQGSYTTRKGRTMKDGLGLGEMSRGISYKAAAIIPIKTTKQWCYFPVITPNNKHKEKFAWKLSLGNILDLMYMFYLSVYIFFLSQKTFLLNTLSFSWEFMLLDYAFREEGLFS